MPEVELKELHEAIEEMRHEHAHEARMGHWLRWVSLSTAVLAVLTSIAALRSEILLNEALIKKNESVLKQAQASDLWAYFQAKGIKRNGAAETADVLASLGNASASRLAGRYRSEASRYQSELTALKRDAEKFERERDARTKQAEALLHRHHKFAYCVTFTQVAIALSAIAAVAKRREVWWLGLVVGLIGIGWFVQGVLAPASGH